MVIDLSKQSLDADQKATQPLNFIQNLERARKTEMFFSIEEVRGAGFFIRNNKTMENEFPRFILSLMLK